ncbi:MAG: glycosyltransferase family 2 protein [Bifidobacteriaceae bacterium]|nr:glycosyltransferase family 2 protein [Bifidobacteriaceae bacterium]
MDNARSVRQAIDAAIMAAGPRQGRVVDSEVAAIVTVESDLRFLPDTLNALFAQTVLPGTVIVADCADKSSAADQRSVIVTPQRLRFAPTAQASAAGRSEYEPPIPSIPQPEYAAQPEYTAQPGHAAPSHGSAAGGIAQRAASGVAGKAPAEQRLTVHIVAVQGAVSFTDAVRRVLERVPLPLGAHQMWLLHDDSKPADEHCLEELLRVRHNTPTVSVIGAKQLDWTGSKLHNVGYYKAPHHRLASLVVDGEPDQEQYDARQDVFAVSLAGALVLDNEWDRVSGGDPHVGTLGDSRDFCRRICLSGGRVVIAPRARIDHRRARYAGVRTASGAPVAEHARLSTYAALRRSRDLYVYSDVSRGLWVPLWLWRWLASLADFIRLLIRKRPYAAVCELAAPWLNLVHIRTMFVVRRNVSAQTVVSAKAVSMLAANHEQLASWKSRRVAFAAERTSEPTDQLVEGHLRAQAAIKHRWAFWMTFIAFALGIAANAAALRDAFLGGQIVSDTLLPTGASLRQLAHAATSSWNYAAGTGTGAAPTPFLLVLLVASALCLGHVNAAVVAMLLLAAPLAALSFWALAGIVTRSNPVRVFAALAWVAFGAMAGLYAHADLPMLMVCVFLPAGIAFVFKAVGMYRTEDRAVPRPSAQSAAMASLCLAIVVACEPQYAIAFVIAFVLFLFLVRSHRSVLVLVPVPAAFAIAPTLSAIVHSDAGSDQWKQLFGSIMVPDSSATGSTAGGSLAAKIGSLLGLGASDSTDGGTLANLLACFALAALIIVVGFALASLAMPSVLRISRMMWVLAVCGLGLAGISAATVIGGDAAGAVRGSVLPGVFLALMALLCCMCMTAGTAASPFENYVADDSQPVKSMAVTGRVFLCALIALIAVAWGLGGARLALNSSVKSSDAQLPMVATEYLSKSDAHRVLAVKASSASSPQSGQSGAGVQFAVMRTSRGDLIDQSAASAALVGSHGMNVTDQRISSDLVQLLVGTNPTASADLESLGFGGVYVLDSDQTAGATLVSNLLSSGNTQQVIDKDSYIYLRFTTYPTDQQGIDISGETEALASPRRTAWAIGSAAVFVFYCLVAIPFGRRDYMGGDFDE